ncbi:MAG: winged helix-turn-helix transcriptional regulator [Rhodobacteraceae bacterium]|nr:metalloregulator ArsR/SmtB family transcription factor [Alphaproteobacteria bacterium]MBT8476956.1 metalloregulator ArsR/SmtB family transcription factor [Alphaproteobacteria bacterium]NNF72369.1 winged helix-turn-helix transcriptional regulator [Paracoccaceae bacterium]NNK68490.1 winged helix-turn-helix transcriptional regulator [Paracoccaceae bacterium]
MNDSLSPALAALADPTRRAILDRLRAGEASAGTLAAPFDISQPAISRHLKVMTGAGLVTHRRDGTRRMFRLAPHRLAEIDAWLDAYRAVLEANYQRLDALLAKDD